MGYEVIIPAAGQGKRMRASCNKLLLELEGRPVILHTLDVFAADEECDAIIVAIRPDEKGEFERMLAGHPSLDRLKLVPGGKERQDSVFNGLQAASGTGIVLVHDGARPFITPAVIRQLWETAGRSGAAIAAVPVKDTIKRADHSRVTETVERAGLWQVQTPQAFSFSVLQASHEKARREGFLGTDESSLVERLPHPVVIVESDYDNIKLTTPEDLYFAESILKKRKSK